MENFEDNCDEDQWFNYDCRNQECYNYDPYEDIYPYDW